MNIQPLRNGCKRRCRDKALPCLYYIVIVICCWGCSPKGNDVEEHVPSDMPQAGLQGFHLVETINGKPQWELSGKNAETKQDIISINNISCTFFHPQTQEWVFKIKANDGRLETNTRGIELTGEVIAEDTTKNLFYSSRIIWDASRLTLTSPEEITLQMKDAVFKADTMNINPTTGVLEARGVRIIIRSG